MPWCILRCAGRHTLPLAASLAADGFEAWAPARACKVRKPRWQVHRDVRLPLMAGFVFAGARRLPDLLELAATPSAHRDFSVFHYLDRIPLVADRDLEPLRELETAAPTPAELANIFRPGERVLVTGGIFGGMGGIVERSDGTYTLVRFGTRMRVKINTFILQPTSVMKRANAASAAQVS